MRLTDAVVELFPDDKKTIAAAYGNQALILNAWGKLEDAMMLHKKEEAIKVINWVTAPDWQEVMATRR